MSLHRDYNLQSLGIQPPIKLHGDLHILREENGLPLVFLIDENHDNLNSSIDKNIINVIRLIEEANVRLVGVESYAGGKEWDEEIGNYVQDNFNERYYTEVLIKDYKNNCLKFAEAIGENHGNLVVGVESIGMMNKTEIDVITKNPTDIGKFIQDHELTKERSKHFIQTLFQEYYIRGINGNLVLNCGSNHNTHIQEWIESGEIDEITNHKANYVRINTFN